MRVAIIDYGSGNLRSATKAFERAAREAGIAAEIDLTADAERVRAADRIVLPGVGAYADCRRGLDAVPGMIEAVEETAIRKGRPFLGICVGMQLMSERGLEKTVTQGFGWIAGDVKEITPADPALKIPQIGWNTIHVKHPHPLFAGIPTGEKGLHAYFVHSYHLDATKPDQVLAAADYGGPVTAAVARDNLAGTQFHPEKSQALGLALIANFLKVETMTTKKGYWMAMVDITDPDGYPRYVAANKAAFDKYGAKFLVRGGEGEVFEGPAATRLVVIEFDSYQTALDCFHSPEYQAALKLRKLYSKAHFAVVEGA